MLSTFHHFVPGVQAAVHVAKIIAQTKLQSLRLNRNPLGDAGGRLGGSHGDQGRSDGSMRSGSKNPDGIMRMIEDQDGLVGISWGFIAIHEDS